MNNYFLACSTCHEVVLKSVSEEMKLRAKVLVFKEDLVYAVCKGCNSEIQVPIRLDEDLTKSLAKKSSGPRLYLKTT